MQLWTLLSTIIPMIESDGSHYQILLGCYLCRVTCPWCVPDLLTAGCFNKYQQYQMGNTLLDKPIRKKIQELDSWLEQNPELMNKKVLFENKCFKTISFMYKSKSQSLLCKVFLKREEIALEQYLRGFDIVKKALDPSYYQNMLTYMQFKNFDQPKEQFVAVFRQFMSSTLQDGLQGQPSLTQQEKIWMIMQMMICVYGLHVQANLYHGNIRTSNFLLESNNHLVLSDFATYKPLYLLEDDLSEVRIFYGSSVDKCTLAPQKLINESQKEKHNRLPMQLVKNYMKDKKNSVFTSTFNQISPKLKAQQSTIDHNSASFDTKNTISSQSNYSNQVRQQKAMDVFSLGISILEVLLNGRTLMTFENLLQMRKGEFSLQGYIEAAMEGFPEDQKGKVKSMLGLMLEVDPHKRLSIQIILDIWKQSFMKDIHVLVWHLQSVFSKSSFILPDMRIGLLRKIVQKMEEAQPQKSRHKMQMDLSIDIQKLDFQRMMLTLIDRNVLPDLQRIGFLEGSLINKIQEELQQQDRSQVMEDKLDKLDVQESVITRSMSVFEMKPKQSSQRDQTNSFTSVQNLKTRGFNQSKQKELEEGTRSLCPPEWSEEFAGLERPKFKGVKLTEQQLSHNQFQELLNEIKESQDLRQKHISQVSYNAYHQYEELIRLIYSNIRTTITVSNRLVAVELLYVVGRGSTTKARLHKVIPYLINVMGDSQERVATFSLRCLIDLFYCCDRVFTSIDDTKYYRTILEGFNTASKSSVLRLVLFQRLPEILKIIQWLSIHQMRYTKVQSTSDQQILVESILKQYGSYNSHQKEVLLSSASKLWLPNFIPFFGSMLNIQKVLGFRQSVKIAEQSHKHKHSKLDFLDMCLESGLDESGVAMFYAIRYFRVRKIVKEEFIRKIVPLILEPNRWIHDEVTNYIRMCLDNYPATKLYFIFAKYLELPFPIEPCEHLGLPDMLPSKTVRDKKFNQKNRTEQQFKKYNARRRPQREYPQASQQQLKKWHQAARTFIPSDEKDTQPRTSNSLGSDIIEFIGQMNMDNLLYYISLVKKPHSEQVYQQQFTKQLYELCERSYSFNINGNSNSISYQKQLLSHIQSYLTTNNESFLKAQNLNSVYFKRLFSQSLMKTNSLLNTIDTFEIVPTLELGKYVRQPTEQSRLARPMGILIGQIHQHKDIVSCIEKIADRYFLSGSYDGTMRLFDSKKIEEDITSDSIGVIDFKQQYNDYSGTIKVTSACLFEDTYTVVAATTKGSVNMYRAEYMGKESASKSKSKKNSSLQLIKAFNATGEVQKVVTLKNQLRHTTFAAVTSEGWLALQDIRIKKECSKCSLGKERGIAKSLINLTGSSALAVGTTNGYILMYDIRCNLISNIYCLNSDGQSLPVLYMQNVPTTYHSRGNQQLVAISYPCKNYQFAYFDLNGSNQQIIDPDQLFTSSNRDDCIITPFLSNKTKAENFKNCNNNLRERTYYNAILPSFYSKLDILDYLRDPLTVNQNLVKEKWLSQSKQKYAQITSISNRKCIPFLEYLPGGILTNLNPAIASKAQSVRFNNKPGSNLTLLNMTPPKKENKVVSPIQQEVRTVGRNVFIPDQEASDFYTSCRVLPHFLVAGSRDSLLKIYK